MSLENSRIYVNRLRDNSNYAWFINVILEFIIITLINQTEDSLDWFTE